jgi:regulator of RNase E activity RraA
MSADKIGFCIKEIPACTLNKDIFERLKGFGTPALSDGLNKFNTVDPYIKPILDDIRVAGPAFTVRLRPGDNLMLHKAIGLARSGDIIMVDTCGCHSYSVMGDLMASAAFKKGIGGIVVDGGIRDIIDLREKRFPIFTRFVTPAVGDKDGPGEIGLPICIGGVPVLPNYFVVGDANGMVIIPPDYLEKIIDGTEKKLTYEKKRALAIEEGVIVNPNIDETLRRAGVIE